MIDRINLLIKHLNLSIRAFEQSIGASNGLIRKAIANKTDIQSKWASAIVDNYPLVDSEWLLTGKGIMLKSDVPRFCQEEEKGSIPYYGNLPVSAGQFGLAVESKPEEPTGYMLIPNVTAEALFPVVGFSFLPLIKPGDIIGVNTVNKWERVDPDKIYLIITNDNERMIKRLRIDNEQESFLWCVSDNYKEFKVYKNEITWIYHVVWHVEPV